VSHLRRLDTHETTRKQPQEVREPKCPVAPKRGAEPELVRHPPSAQPYSGIRRHRVTSPHTHESNILSLHAQTHDTVVAQAARSHKLADTEAYMKESVHSRPTRTTADLGPNEDQDARREGQLPKKRPPSNKEARETYRGHRTTKQTTTTITSQHQTTLYLKYPNKLIPKQSNYKPNNLY